MQKTTNSLLELEIRLTPLGPLHLGDTGSVGISADRIHSDTLWSALFLTAHEMGQTPFTEVMLEPDFLISSSFPTLDHLKFLPRPYVRLKGEMDPAHRKQWKKVAFVSDAIFKRLTGPCACREISLDDTLLLPEGCLAFKAEIKNSEKIPWIQGKDTTTGNVLDRLTSMADLFSRTDLRVNTARGAGLGFFARMPQASRDDFEMVLTELGKRGVGGDRSTGKGAFAVKSVEPRSFSGSPKTGQAVILSLYHPTQWEVQSHVLEKACYDLVIRGGWVDLRAYQKKRLRMLGEGAVVPLVNSEGLGDVKDVRPNGWPHPVFRYGRAYPVSMED